MPHTIHTLLPACPILFTHYYHNAPYYSHTITSMPYTITTLSTPFPVYYHYIFYVCIHYSTKYSHNLPSVNKYSSLVSKHQQLHTPTPTPYRTPIAHYRTPLHTHSAPYRTPLHTHPAPYRTPLNAHTLHTREHTPLQPSLVQALM